MYLSRKQREPRDRGQRGQTTIALALVLAVGCFAGLAMALIGQAIVHRARARNAADAVALAAVVEPDAAAELADWYGRQGTSVDYAGDRAVASSGPSQAAAWAAVVESTDQPAPALVAILARAEQLVGTTFAGVRWRTTAVALRSVDAMKLRSVAADLGLCDSIPGEPIEGWDTFELC